MVKAQAPSCLDDAAVKSFSEFMKKKAADTVVLALEHPENGLKAMVIGFTDGRKGIARTRGELAELGLKSEDLPTYRSFYWQGQDYER